MLDRYLQNCGTTSSSRIYNELGNAYEYTDVYIYDFS